jgi:hypothetical protein
MTRLAGLCSGSILLIAVLAISGCGSSRQLQHISVSPSAADARNFRNGQVQFTAIGTFSKAPSPAPLTSQQVQWCFGGATGECAGNIEPYVIIDPNGLAHCNPSFVGTATILVGTQPVMPMNPDVGSQLTIFGSAKLTCP